MRAPQSEGAGPSNQNHVQNPERQEEPGRVGGRLVINVVSDSPRTVKRSWGEMKSYNNLARRTDFEYDDNLDNKPSTKRKRATINDITFRDNDTDYVGSPTTDPLVISAQVGPAWMKRILIDCGSSVNILFIHAYNQMRMKARDLEPCQTHLHGFNGSATIPIGMVKLPVRLGSKEHRRVRTLQFTVLNIVSPYNAFLG